MEFNCSDIALHQTPTLTSKPIESYWLHFEGSKNYEEKETIEAPKMILPDAWGVKKTSYCRMLSES